MKMNCIVNKYKFVIATVCCVAFAAIAALVFLWGFKLPALIFFALSILYFLVALHNGAIVRVDQNGVSRRFPKKGLSMSWESIREVGIVGLRILNSKGKRYTGTRYIYFSTKTLTEDDRFQLCLEWPPKDILFIRFSYKRIAAVQMIWEKEIVMYNTGNLQL